ncbi:MAG: transporter [Deltaproteobacteria bacterium]|nr:MAG: transporter [Deltaproteobacteria bacterium]
MGLGKPFAGRLRLSGELRHRTDTIGVSGVDELRLSERRLDLAVAYLPRWWLSLSATVPLVHVDVTHVNGARERALGLGDADLRARTYVWRDRAFSPRHLVGLDARVKLPTGPELDTPVGTDLFRIESQPGTGSVDAAVGASYGYFRDPWSAYASALAVLPGTGYRDVRAGRSLRATVAAQFQPSPRFGYRLGVDARWDAVTTEAGEVEDDTGGFIAFVTPQVIYSPITDVVVHAYVRIPAVNALYGRHDEGAIVAVGVTRDL